MINKNYMSTPTRFWLTQGNGESNVSKLSANDEAFIQSGIGYQNHVMVSSIPPSVEIQPRILSQKGVTYVPFKDDFKLIPPSSILYVV
ncbi:MAG: hypothetical protein KGD64_08330, partial [Candidatus Heimdallarchaeota archaeon]|nr:hypothetical protein [Candidatus Heimdallarchaeota archaeon]